MENTNIEYFNTQLKKFINEIITSFPEYNDILNDYYGDVLKTDICNDDKYVKRFMRKTNDLKVQISKKDTSIFENDIYILKNVNFKEIWNKPDLSNNNRDVIWDYIQMLFVIGGTIISDNNKIDDLMQQFKSLQEESNTENTPDIDNDMLEMLKNLSNSSRENASNIDESLFKNGMIGQLAQELSQEINLDIDENNESSNPSDIFSNLMSGENPMKFMNLIQTVGSKIQNKVSSGELNQEKLLEEAQGMMGMLTNGNPLLNNILQGQGFPQQQQTQQPPSNHSYDNPTRERLRKKLNSRKNK